MKALRDSYTQSDLDYNGKVTLIWDDGHKIERPIMGTIRGIIHGEDRYSSYILEPKNHFCLEALTQTELLKFRDWLATLNAGLKRRSA